MKLRRVKVRKNEVLRWVDQETGQKLIVRGGVDDPDTTNLKTGKWLTPVEKMIRRLERYG